MNGHSNKTNQQLVKDLLSDYQNKYSEIQEKIFENINKSFVNSKKHVKILLDDNSLNKVHQETNSFKLLQKYKTKLVQVARLSEELNTYSNPSSKLITKVSKFSSKNVNYPDHTMMNMSIDSKSDHTLQDHTRR